MSSLRPLIALLPSFGLLACTTSPVPVTRFYCEPVPIHLLERPGMMPEIPPTLTVETAEQVIATHQNVYLLTALRLIELQLAVEAREEKNNDGF